MDELEKLKLINHHLAQCVTEFRDSLDKLDIKDKEQVK